MRISGLSRPEPASTKKPDRTKGSGTAFSVATNAAEASTSASAPAPLAPVDALLALQEQSDALESRRRATRRGRDTLNLLDDVRHGLLSGGISRLKLDSLVATIRAQRTDIAEPELDSLLGEIELRARVELAKLGHYS